MSIDGIKTTPAAALHQPTDQMWRDILPQLQTFVRRRIADPNRADDLLADILLRIHQNVGALNDEEKLPNWALRIARNAIVDEYRRAGRNREHPVSTLSERSDPALTDDDEPAALHELSACLRPLLAGLPVEQRMAVEMIDLDGVSQAEAAQRAEVSLSGMKSRVQRGRRRLAELLGQCCALTLDARGMPMDYEPPPGCECAGR
ncbi:sigma-70 family RNA polymerase sigma factor [Mycobacterium sp. IS-3022]|uniref:sigma-70 family RNA polymerase sigma factor n=1 Tax=Mycobacterium sp. IS-3022 TaxID=1772277 RepID=UPI0007416B77|nr:sigma-70 family RNA polymerase sigma factor [Mycobacterium sp. IS-3022]KUI01999.1 RNA polymerase subunit sigma-24 [Mycobacterium sp. IS-3022]